MQLINKIIDLTHKFTKYMPVHSYDEPSSIKRIRSLDLNKYNDWKLSSGMHAGTHIDGPGHLTNSEILLSDYPADKFIGKGFLVDARNKSISKNLLINMPEEEGLIVLILTGSDKKFGTKEYFTEHSVIPDDFAEELVKRKIKMVGIDFFSPDKYPFPVHQILFKNKVLIIENLTNLESLLSLGSFKVVALPIKTETDSALARVVAMGD
jgi:kynurenine formamidase